MGMTKFRRGQTPRFIARWSAFFILCVCLAAAAHAEQQSNNQNELAQQGWDAIEAKRYGDALKSFTAATDVAPEWAGLWFGRGYAEYLLGRDRTAERSLQRSIELDGSRGNAHSILGELLYRTGRVDEAIETYETATQTAQNGSDFQARLDEWKQEQQLQDGFGKASGRHFRVLFEGRNDDALARRAADILEAAYRNVGNTLRTYPTQTITVLLYTEQQFHDITRAPAWSGGSYDGQIRIPTKGALQDPGQLERILIHEYVHALVAQLGGRRVPHWVNEGLATRLEPGGLDRSRDVLSRVASQGRLCYSLASTNPAERCPPSSRWSRAIGRRQSMLMQAILDACEGSTVPVHRRLDECSAAWVILADRARRAMGGFPGAAPVEHARQVRSLENMVGLVRSEAPELELESLMQDGKFDEVARRLKEALAKASGDDEPVPAREERADTPSTDRTPEEVAARTAHAKLARQAFAIAERHAADIIRGSLVTPYNSDGRAYDEMLDAVTQLWKDQQDEPSFDAGYAAGLAVGLRLAGHAG